MLKRETILAIFISTIALLIAIGKPILTTTDDMQPTISVNVTGEYFQIADSVAIDIEYRGRDILPEDLFSTVAEWQDTIEILDDETADAYHYRFGINNYAYNDDLPDPLNPYIVMRVVLHDLTRFDEFVAHLISLEVTSLSYTNFFVHDEDMMLREAENNALESARADAERLANREGYELGDILTIEISPSPQNYQSDNYDYGMLEFDSQNDGSLLNPPPIRARVDATVTFELR